MKERESPKKLLDCARKIATAIGQDSCALIGGLALAAFGYVRGTIDVDFIASGSPNEIVKVLSENGILGKLNFGEPGDPLPWVVSGYVDGVKFDIIPQVAHSSVEKGISIEDFGLSICSLEDLVSLKCYAGGPQDLLDVANLVRVRPEIREAVLSAAEKHGVLDPVEKLILGGSGRRGIAHEER